MEVKLPTGKMCVWILRRGVKWTFASRGQRSQCGILHDIGFNNECHPGWGHEFLSHHFNEAGFTHLHTENSGNHGGRTSERCQFSPQWPSRVPEVE